MKFWGILDLAAISWYFCMNFVEGKIPFLSDLVQANATSISFGSSMPLIVSSISLFLYLSLVLSGILLVKGLKYGAILSYIQCPFRLLAIMPISLFFLVWPVKYIFGPPEHFDLTLQAILQPPVIVYLSLRVLSESIKTVTVARWHIALNKLK